MHWKINKETLKQNFSLSIKSGQETWKKTRNKGMHWKINKETLKQNFSLSIKSGQETCNSLRSKTPFLTCFISSWSPQFNPRSWKMQKNCVVQGQTAFSRLAHIGNQSTRRRTNSPTPTCRHIKSSRDVGELVVNPVQLIRS